MTLALSTPVLCGDMPGPGFAQQSVEANPSGAHHAIGEPVGGQASEQPGTDSAEATSDPVDQAIFFAIQLFNSLI